jgi:thymidylate synthase
MLQRNTTQSKKGIIELISAVFEYKNKLYIGRNNGLIYYIKKDIQFFKKITTNSLNIDSKLNKNIILMGRKTFESMSNKTLQNRINLILTENKKLIKETEKIRIRNIEENTQLYKYIDMTYLEKVYEKYNPKIFIIGGGFIYNMFLNLPEHLKHLQPSKVYLTQIKSSENIKIDESFTSMDHLSQEYKLIGYSNLEKQNNLSYRTLYYKYVLNHKTEENLFIDLAKDIIKNGKDRIDRTNTGTISKFATQLKFDISNETIPLLTTKRVPLKSIIEELLFFCKGDTDTTILEKKGVNIWSGNTSRSFLDNRGLNNYPDGNMGPMYGHMFRNFGGDYSTIGKSILGTGIDQLVKVENLLKTDPFNRRIYITNLNPKDTDKMCLESCHTYIQFYVTEDTSTNKKYLSSYFTMRSSDYFLAAISFNLISYNILTRILALRCGMEAKEIVYNAVDCHIYKNHTEQIHKQISRNPRPFPKLKLSNDLKYKDWSDMDYKDFELIGYFPHPSIKAPMAI